MFRRKRLKGYWLHTTERTMLHCIVGSGTFDFPLEGDAMHAQWLDE
jgi:hypothetical protein